MSLKKQTEISTYNHVKLGVNIHNFACNTRNENENTKDSFKWLT